MLEIKDIQHIFSYIKQLHQHCPADKIPKLTQAVADSWIRALDGYAVEEVYKAADAHARSCRFWPSLSEIVKQLPPRTEARGGLDDELLRRYLVWSRLYREKLQGELERLGLPNLRGSSGAECTKWREDCETAGVDFNALMEAAYRVAYGKD